MRVEGLSVPYTMSTDNTLSLVILLCSLLSIMIVMRSRNILSLRIRSLFVHTTNLSNYRRTKNNAREELFLTALSVMSLSLIGYSAELHYFGTELAANHYLVMASYAGIFIIFLLLKRLLYMLTIPIYCNIQQWRAWRHLFSFTTALQGLWFLPIAIINIYLGLSAPTTLILAIIGVTIAFFVRIYNAWSIFFKKKRLYVPFFLYLCTLEAVPLAILSSTLICIAHTLKGA